MVASFLAGLSVLTVLFNYLVDPFLVLGTKRVPGFNFSKVEIDNHASSSKAYHPLFGDWDTLLIGNSRIEMGLDPNHSCFQKSGAKVYNLGLPGMSVRGQLEYALNIIYQQPIERVLLSLDFVDFLVRTGQAPPAEDIEWDTSSSPQLRYAFDGSLNPDYSWKKVANHYRALFSLDALVSSAKTVALQAASHANADRDDHGFNPARNFEHGVSVEGPHAFFSQKMAKLASKYQQGWSLTYNDGSLSRDFTFLTEFLEISSRRGVDVILFTNPFHELFWDMLRENRLYELHQEWLVLIQDKIAATAIADISMWDFSGNSEYIHETVPARGVKSKPLKWFWEPAHYRKQLGDLMLDTMLASECNTESRFGEKLR